MSVALPSPLAWMHVLVSAFLAVLFLQSGFDKIFDWKGNLEWLTGHFERSPLAGAVPAMLLVVTIVEVAAGGVSAAAVPALVVAPHGLGHDLAQIGASLSALALLMLFFGQRMAKDYAGAAVLVNYFLLVIFGMYLLQLPSL